MIGGYAQLSYGFNYWPDRLPARRADGHARKRSEVVY